MAPARGIENLTPAIGTEVGGLVAGAIDGARIAFDGRPASPRMELVVPQGGVAALKGAPELTIRLSGAIPPGARAFTWSNTGAPGAYMLTIRAGQDERAERRWLEGAQESPPFALDAAIVPMTRAEVFRAYLELGFTHILPKGTDHILFVLGIFLLSIRVRPVLLQVTAFTVAHTISLALTIYGVVAVSPRIVEPLIAFSIVYVGIENLVRPTLTPWRVALVFAFGLLHGMGFAGVLAQLGLPRSEFLPALLSFNVGVELGQLTVIAAAFLLVGLAFREKPWYRARVVVPGSVAVAAIGLVWFAERVAG